MFKMFDITNSRQVITVQQANEALKTILGPEADISHEDLWGSATKMMKKETCQACPVALRAASLLPSGCLILLSHSAICLPIPNSAAGVCHRNEQGSAGGNTRPVKLPRV